MRLDSGVDVLDACVAHAEDGHADCQPSCCFFVHPDTAESDYLCHLLYKPADRILHDRAIADPALEKDLKGWDVSRHKSIDALQAYVRDADLFRDYAGTGLL